MVCRGYGRGPQARERRGSIGNVGDATRELGGDADAVTCSKNQREQTPLKVPLIRLG
jgi:hypothetical protein